MALIAWAASVGNFQAGWMQTAPQPLPPLPMVPTAAGGLTVAQFFVPGNTWSSLQPTTKLRFTTVASGVAPGGGAYAVVEMPSFQLQVPSFGTHYPVRFMPARVALGPSVDSSAGGSDGGSSGGSGVADSSGSSVANSSSGTGPWSSQPAAAGSLVIPYCCGDVERLEWAEAPPSAAAVGRPLAMLASAMASAAALAFAGV